MIKLRAPASNVACALITLAGLDDETATLEDMHALDLRYAVVREDLPKAWALTEGCEVFIFQGALRFGFGTNYSVTRPTTRFRLATPQETEKARQHAASLKQTAEVWRCNRCDGSPVLPDAGLADSPRQWVTTMTEAEVLLRASSTAPRDPQPTNTTRLLRRLRTRSSADPA